MKATRWLLGLLFLAGCDHEGPGPRTASTPAADPQRPLADLEVIDDEPAPIATLEVHRREGQSLEADVVGLVLVDPSERHEDIEGEGHIGVRIDGRGPVIKTTDTRMSFHGLSPGEHDVEVFLLRNDGTPLGPKRVVTLGGPTAAIETETESEIEPVAGRDEEKAKAGPQKTPHDFPEQVALAVELVNADENARRNTATFAVSVDGNEGDAPLLYYRLDRGPILGTRDQTLGFHDLASGQHELLVFLADSEELPAGVQRTVSFTIP